MSFRVDIPVIETERLILRGVTPEDHPQFAAYFATERSHFTGGPQDEVEVFATMMRMAGHWHLRGFGLWTIEDRATGTAAGWAGILLNFDWPEPELGWTVFGNHEGKGLAFEAATAARLHAARHLGIRAPISLIRPSNARSAALARRMDAVLENPDGLLRGIPCHIWRHPDVLSEGAAA